MNYLKLYEQLIQEANNKNRKKVKGLYEFDKHHIKPKFNGGDNSKDNLVLLTPKEHFIAHKLLHKIFKNRSSAFAIWRMINCQYKVIKSSNEYQRIKYEIALYNSINKHRIGKLHSDETKMILSIKAKERYANKNNHPLFGKTVSFKTKQKISESQKIRLQDKSKITKIIWTDEMRKTMSEKMSKKIKGNSNPFFGKTQSEDVKLKLKELRIGGRWMNKEYKSKFVFKDQIANHLNDNWQFGRI